MRRFDDAEISRLRKMAPAGHRNVDIARALGRSPAATLAKAAELGIMPTNACAALGRFDTASTPTAKST
jgi:hypothetical protein